MNAIKMAMLEYLSKIKSANDVIIEDGLVNLYKRVESISIPSVMAKFIEKHRPSVPFTTPDINQPLGTVFNDVTSIRTITASSVFSHRKVSVVCRWFEFGCRFNVLFRMKL
jgi:ethanolamine utilization protein EutA (predicted chaperonin)